MSSNASNAVKRERVQRVLLGILLLLLFAVLVEGVLVSRHVYVLWRHGMRLRGLMSNPAAVLNPEEPALIGEDLSAIGTALRGLRTELGPVLRPIWLPSDSMRQNLTALDGLLKVGADLANAGQVATGGLQSIAEALSARDAAGAEQPAVGMTEVLFAGLAGARPYFQQAAPMEARRQAK